MSQEISFKTEVARREAAHLTVAALELNESATKLRAASYRSRSRAMREFDENVREMQMLMQMYGDLVHRDAKRIKAAVDDMEHTDKTLGEKLISAEG